MLTTNLMSLCRTLRCALAVMRRWGFHVIKLEQFLIIKIYLITRHRYRRLPYQTCLPKSHISRLTFWWRAWVGYRFPWGGGGEIWVYPILARHNEIEPQQHKTSDFAFLWHVHSKNSVTCDEANVSIFKRQLFLCIKTSGIHIWGV